MGVKPGDFKLPRFGKYAGQSLWDVSKQEKGLDYLKWFRNEFLEKPARDPKYQKGNDSLKWALDRFFERDDIKAKLGEMPAKPAPVEEKVERPAEPTTSPEDDVPF